MSNSAKYAHIGNKWPNVLYRLADPSIQPIAISQPFNTHPAVIGDYAERAHFTGSIFCPYGQIDIGFDLSKVSLCEKIGNHQHHRHHHSTIIHSQISPRHNFTLRFNWSGYASGKNRIANHYNMHPCAFGGGKISSAALVDIIRCTYSLTRPCIESVIRLGGVKMQTQTKNETKC